MKKKGGWFGELEGLVEKWGEGSEAGCDVMRLLERMRRKAREEARMRYGRWRKGDFRDWVHVLPKCKGCYFRGEGGVCCSPSSMIIDVKGNCLGRRSKEDLSGSVARVDFTPIGGEVGDFTYDLKIWGWKRKEKKDG